MTFTPSSARKAGKSKTPAKRASSRENGKKRGHDPEIRAIMDANPGMSYQAAWWRRHHGKQGGRIGRPRKLAIVPRATFPPS